MLALATRMSQLRYYCYVCEEPITEKVYRYSTDHHGRALCMKHQKTVSAQELRLSDALKRLDIQHKLEYWDGHKTIDIAILWANLYIELEGLQHGFNARQMSADDDRDAHSQKEGFYTKRIYNDLVDKDVERLASAIARLSRKRYRQIKEQSSVIGKLKKGYGILKTGYSVLERISNSIEDDEDFRDDDY